MPGEVGSEGKGRRSDWLEPKMGHGIALVNNHSSNSRCFGTFEAVNEARPAEGDGMMSRKPGESAIQA
jgi:hypothetical protein